MSTGETLVFVVVIGARFLVPLLIPKFPLPAIIACLVLDAADQSIFQAIGFDPPGYQGYDKAMDVYYLAMAYLSTLRNWTSLAAYRVSRFLYFYRLVGVVAFELTQMRALLLVFPNTFEYFFIAYEAIRSRWRTTRWGLRWWIGVAAFIWVFIKLPQEWWIHVAQLDFTDFLADHSWAGPTIVALLLVAFAVFWVWGRPRLLPADHTWRFAADPLPEELETAAEQSRAYADNGARLVDRDPREGGADGPAVGHLRPDAPGGAMPRTSGCSSASSQWSWSMPPSPWRWPGAPGPCSRSLSPSLLAPWRTWRSSQSLNGWSTASGGSIDAGATLFFLTMISLLTTLHDHWYPVMESRVASSDEGTGVAPVTS